MNWGPGAAGGFQNALAMGVQLGGIARQREEQNALMQQRERQIDLAEQKFNADQLAAMDKANAEAELNQLTAAAVNGDEQARQRLLATNFERFQKVDATTKARLAEEQERYGQAASYALSLGNPRAIRQAVIDFGMQNRDEAVIKVAQLPDDQMIAALRNQVFEAGMVKDLIAMERPERFNVGPGEARYERNPRTGEIRTIVQPNYGNAPAFSPAQGGAPSISDIDAELRRRGVIK